MQQQPQQQQKLQQQPKGAHGCTPRLTFWIAAGASWLVWMFAVAAGADDKWLTDEDGEDYLAAGEDGTLDFCSDADDVEDDTYQEFCAMYRAFTAMQILATIACSVSVLLLSIAFFRPSAGGCSSARSLAFVGGGMMVTYALFQLIAVVLGGTMKAEADSITEAAADDFFFGDDSADVEGDFGPTFAVGVVALILAIAFAVLLLLFARHAGDGPLFSCCHSLMLANKANGSPPSGGGATQAAVSGEPQPLPAATAPAAPHYSEEAGNLPPPPQQQISSLPQQQISSLPAYDELPHAAS